MKNLLIILLMPIFLSSCALFQAKSVPLIVENRTAQIPVFHPPLPNGVIMGRVEWKVLTPEIMDEYLKDLRSGKASTSVYYAITPKTYETLANNIADLKRYIKHQQSIIFYYRENLKYTAPPEDSEPSTITIEESK